MAEKKSSNTIVVLAIILAAVAGFGAVYVNLVDGGNDQQASNAESGKPASKGKSGLRAYSKGHMATFVAAKAPKELPPIPFVNADGSETSIDAWKGKVVLLNLWATWCAPCREEMPWLDDLKAEFGGPKFDLIALSLDRTGLAKPQAFFKEIDIKHLKLYNNSTGKLASDLKAFGMPTTLLLNKKGQEIGRLVGPAEWNSQDARELIKAAIAEAG